MREVSELVQCVRKPFGLRVVTTLLDITSKLLDGTRLAPG